MKKQFIIVDATDTAGKNFIDENDGNVSLEHARIFATEDEAQDIASLIDAGDGWAEVLPLSAFSEGK